MSSNHNKELRIVASAVNAETARTTLRIDAQQPVPAPQSTAAESNEQRIRAAEQELDRLNHAANTELAAVSHHMNWLIASQAIFLHAFLMVFVVGAMGVIPMNHWLLGGLALVGILCAVALHASLDRSRQSLALLLVHRRAAEVELAGLAGRTPSLPQQYSKAGSWLGPAFVIAWLALLAVSAAVPL